MKPVLIDFAPAGAARLLARTGLMTWLGLALGLAACASAVSALATMRADQRDLAVRAARDHRPAAVVAAPAPAIAAERINAVNAVVMQLNLPWDGLRAALVHAASPGVALLALTPDARRRNLRLSAQAVSAGAMVDYVARLKREALLRSVVLTHHERDDADNGALRFELTLTWGAP